MSERASGTRPGRWCARLGWCWQCRSGRCACVAREPGRSAVMSNLGLPAGESLAAVVDQDARDQPADSV